jgi:hypothetical protein
MSGSAPAESPKRARASRSLGTFGRALFCRVGCSQAGELPNRPLGPLPQMYADPYGWQDKPPMVADTEHQLPAAEQKGCGIFGQAGAIDSASKPIPCQQGEAGDILKELGVPAGAT